MNKMSNILVLMPPDVSVSPALHRAMAWARRSGATLHLNLFVHYESIDYARAVFGEEVAGRARQDFVDERMKRLAALSAGLADNGLRVECDVIWARNQARAIVARCSKLRPDLVIKDVPMTDDVSGRLRPSPLDWKLLHLLPAPFMLVRPTAMLDAQRIFAAIDVSVPRAAALLNERIFEAAQLCASVPHAQLRVGSVFPGSPIVGYDTGFIAETWKLMDSAHKKALRQFADAHGVNAASTLRDQIFDTAAGIVRLAEDSAADLVVLGSSYHLVSGYRSIIDRLVFGSTADSVIRQLAADVLLVKPAGFGISNEQLPKRAAGNAAERQPASSSMY